MGLNADQWYSVIRQVLLAIGAVAVYKGWFSNDQLTTIVGAVATVVSSALSFIFHSNAGQSLVTPPAPSK